MSSAPERAPGTALPAKGHCNASPPEFPPPQLGASFTVDSEECPTRTPAELKEGLMTALADLRSQNSDLSTQIDTLGQETKNRAASELAVIEKIRLAQAPAGSAPGDTPRQLPAAPEPVTVLEFKNELKAARRENETSAHQIKALRREGARKDRLATELKAKVATQSSAAAADVRDEFKALLERRCEELENQMKQAEAENSALRDRVNAAEDSAAQLGVQLQREELQHARSTMNGQQQEQESAARVASSRPAAKDNPAKHGPDVIMLLEMTAGERDEAVAMAQFAERSRAAVQEALRETQRHTDLLAAALGEAETRIETMSRGFEKATQMTMQYSAKLEKELADARAKVDAQGKHIALIEAQYRAQGEDMRKLVSDLDKERFRVAETTNQGSVKESINLMRMKQEEHNAHAAIAAKIGRFAELTGGGKAMPAEAKGILREMKELVSAASTLPPGWDAATSPEGLTFYIDHNVGTTSWVRPTIGVSAILLQTASGWIGEVEMAQGGRSIPAGPGDHSEDDGQGYIDIQPDREFLVSEGKSPGLAEDGYLKVPVTKPKKGLRGKLRAKTSNGKDSVRPWSEFEEDTSEQ